MFHRIRPWILTALAAATLTVPASSQSYLNVYIWNEARWSNFRAWRVMGMIEGDQTSQAEIDRVDIYAYLFDYPNGQREQPYFLGSAAPVLDGDDTAAFSLLGGGWYPVPPTGLYTLEARAHNRLTNTYTVGTNSKTTRFAYYIAEDGKTGFVGNRNPDLLLFEPATGILKVWDMSGHRVAAEHFITSEDSDHAGPPAGWRVVGTGDWTGTYPSLLLQHDDGWLWLWVNGGTRIVTTTWLYPARIEPPWRVEATADMNLDGWPDLILRRQDTGDLLIAFMRENRAFAWATPEPDRLRDTNWQIVGAADMNHDMSPDILWQHRTRGELMVLLMNGTTMISSEYLDPWYVTDPYWRVRSVVDLNNDSWPDLVLQHLGHNFTQIWFMRGLRLIDSQWLSAGGYGAQVPYGWEIVGPK